MMAGINGRDMTCLSHNTHAQHQPASWHPLSHQHYILSTVTSRARSGTRDPGPVSILNHSMPKPRERVPWRPRQAPCRDLALHLQLGRLQSLSRISRVSLNCRLVENLQPYEQVLAHAMPRLARRRLGLHSLFSD